LRIRRIRMSAMTDQPPALGTYQHVHTSRQEEPQYSSSITIGTPGKGGEVKIYFDPADSVDAERRIREAFRLREMARQLSEVITA
jgi:hypothetical protein